jgi:hypothetical protein
MKFSLAKFTSLDIGWNERPLDEADFYRLCRRLKITVEELPLRVEGFYYCVLAGISSRSTAVCRNGKRSS